MYLLRLALRPFRVAPFSQLFSSLAVGFLLVLACSLFWMQTSLKPLIAKLKAEQVLTVYLSPTAPDQTESQWVDQIRMQLGAQSQAEVNYVGSNDFIHLIQNQYPTLARELEDLGQEAQQVIPRYISISGVIHSSVIAGIKKLTGVESMESSKDRYHHIVGAFSVLRWIAKILIAGICFALLVGMIHLARMNAYLHRDVLKLLHFWGANRWTLLLPGVISGSIVGFIGGFFASIFWLSLGKLFIHYIQSLSGFLKYLPTNSIPFFWLLILAGGLLGAVSGLIGKSWGGGYSS